MNFSVLMPVYDGERPEFLRQSLESLVMQTAHPTEVMIVRDGPLNRELDSVLASYANVLPMNAVKLEKHGGLGRALRVGLDSCSNEIIARMDSDDICLPHRFESQLEFFERHLHAAAVGAAIGEFVDDPHRIVSVRRLPCGGKGLRNFAKFRNPLNHMTVMFRRSAVVAAGGYRNFPGLEDYDLWVRMLARGMEIRNMPEILVLVRSGNGMAKRRGGVAYARNEIRLYRHFLKIGFVSAPECSLSILTRVIVRIIPAALRPIIYRKFLRQEATPS
jgi:glycosyltransferase involved in cell wall biosynthesis